MTTRVCLFVQCEKIDATPTFVPVGKLLGDYQRLRSQNLDFRAKEPLEIKALVQPFLFERC